MLLFSRLGRIFCGLCVCALLVSTALGQTSYSGLSQDNTPIPDVNKLFPLSGDNSCWLASASNILAAAGYGAGGPAQVRAQGIYSQLTATYGTMSGGAPDKAISHWLAWHGKNPNSPDYRPTLAYTDVAAKYAGFGPSFTQTEYNFLKGELYNGQYVGVQFDSPAHAMTFVGWDDNLGQSTWTDSDRNFIPNGYDSYVNSFSPAWSLDEIVPVGTRYLSNANGYVTFCPGLNKDPVKVANYDVAWAPGPTSPLVPAAREAGLMATPGPGHFDSVLNPNLGWQTQWWSDPNNPNVFYDPFRIDNELDLTKQKQIELLVDFYDRNLNYANEDVRLRYLDALGQEVVLLPTSTELSELNGQVLFTWKLDIQPAWEEVLFPSSDYQTLEGIVASWDVALICVPEPGTLTLLVVAGLGLLGYARRRR